MKDASRYYDDTAKHVLERTGSAGVIVVVMGGNYGSGFGIASVNGMIDADEVARLMRAVATSFENATPSESNAT